MTDTTGTCTVCVHALSLQAAVTPKMAEGAEALDEEMPSAAFTPEKMTEHVFAGAQMVTDKVTISVAAL